MFLTLVSHPLPEVMKNATATAFFTENSSILSNKLKVDLALLTSLQLLSQ